MSRLPTEVPTPNQIAEEPLRPLLATVQIAALNLLHALYAESPDAFHDAEPPEHATHDPARWTEPALARSLEHLLEMFDLHEHALVERNAYWRNENIEF